VRAELEALVEDGYTVAEAAAELGLPEVVARRALEAPADGNGAGDPEAVGEARRPREAHTRPEAGDSKGFRRKPRSRKAVAAEARRAERRLLALPRGRRVEMLAGAMAAMRGEELPPTHTPGTRRKAYITLAEFALRALEMLLDEQRDPPSIVTREKDL
jgi:hypothetical protein